MGYSITANLVDMSTGPEHVYHLVHPSLIALLHACTVSALIKAMAQANRARRSIALRAPSGIVAPSAVTYPGIPLPFAPPAPPRHLLVRGRCEILHPLRGVEPLPRQAVEPPPAALLAGQRQVVGLRRHLTRARRAPGGTVALSAVIYCGVPRPETLKPKS